jgi:crotonobetainyl-CoA:carnitine CoA-transferase CaiB-like acyl-CoA transferase
MHMAFPAPGAVVDLPTAPARPLSGITVLELATGRAAASAGLRLADLGARVIRIERPDGDGLAFHAIHRNKESFTTDLADAADRSHLEELIRRSDVLIHDLGPAESERLGLDSACVLKLNPRIVYAKVTGYGKTGPWRDKPADDLTVQAVSGLTWLTGNQDDPPTPFGLPVVDVLCGTHLSQGIMAALIGRARTGCSATVAVSLLESALDFQFEVLTTHFADGGRLPRRSKRFNAHPYLSAPYGVYPTGDGFLALGMGDVGRLGLALGSPEIAAYSQPDGWFEHRDEIQRLLADHLRRKTTADWLAILEPMDIWCADCFDCGKLTAHDAYRVLEMEQTVRRASGVEIRTLRCPIRIDGRRLFSDRAAPTAGEHNAVILAELSKPAAPPPPARSSMSDSSLPIDGIVVVDLSQFLSGPCASLRLADLGARVIKVEKPITGDICRQLYISDTRVDGESTTFHAINRNKESFVADLKSDIGLRQLKALIGRADVMMHNFRPGVIERLGLGYADVRAIRPSIIYGSISGYGTQGPWRDKPGQDLLVQSLSGLTWLSGQNANGPVPMGLSVVDQLAGMHLAQGILALLFRRLMTGQGGLVEVSMLESALDFQVEKLTEFFQCDSAALRADRPAMSSADAINWKQLAPLEAFQELGMVQTVVRHGGTRYRTTRCPIWLDGRRIYAEKGSPDLGEHTTEILKEMGL